MGESPYQSDIRVQGRRSSKLIQIPKQKDEFFVDM